MKRNRLRRNKRTEERHNGATPVVLLFDRTNIKRTAWITDWKSSGTDSAETVTRQRRTFNRESTLTEITARLVKRF